MFEQNQIDKNREQIAYNIKTHGCHIILVEATQYLPGFAYTIGLHENYNTPELICFGLPIDVLGDILNDVCEYIKGGCKLVTGLDYSLFIKDHNVQFLEVNKDYYRNYFGYALWYYGKTCDFSALQIIFPDKSGIYPWDDNFNKELKFHQPLLDRNLDFKFYEERNVAVFTTKHVLEKNPIIYVYHDKDGDWQFHSELGPEMKDARVVALETITKIDSSVNDLFDLEYGWCARRDNISDDWQRTEQHDEEG